MRYDQAAILTDLDGTLFDSRGEVSKETRAAIREFIAGGGLFAASTGREPRNARRQTQARRYLFRGIFCSCCHR